MCGGCSVHGIEDNVYFYIIYTIIIIITVCMHACVRASVCIYNNNNNNTLYLDTKIQSTNSVR